MRSWKDFLRKHRLSVIIIIAMLCAACAGGGYYRYNHNSSKESSSQPKSLDEIQKEKVQELAEVEGQYNETSIVLADTTKKQAKQIAEEIGAKVRITKQGDYAVLYLPDDVTIDDGDRLQRRHVL